MLMYYFVSEMNNAIKMILKLLFNIFISNSKMSSWDVLQSAFGGDETINFGPRCETGSALYQVTTFATVSSSDKVSFWL